MYVLGDTCYVVSVQLSSLWKVNQKYGTVSLVIVRGMRTDRFGETAYSIISHRFTNNTGFCINGRSFKKKTREAGL